MMNDRKPRYFFVGIINTIFGYCFGIFLYNLLSPASHMIFIATMISIVNISFSFVTFKIWVFKSKGSWWRGYIRSYMVYGVAALISIALIWLLVAKLHIPFWIAQAFLIFINVVVSYLGHSKFTFASKRNWDEK